MPYYAQIDEDGICKAVTETHSLIDSEDMILIDGFDDSLLFMKRVDAAWETVPVDPPPEPGPDRLTQLEQVIDAILTGGETP